MDVVKDECKHQLKGDASKVFEFYELMQRHALHRLNCHMSDRGWRQTALSHRRKCTIKVTLLLAHLSSVTRHEVSSESEAQCRVTMPSCEVEAVQCVPTDQHAHL
jgi:hypothetical protein